MRDVRFNHRLFFFGIFLLAAVTRLCHVGILWTEEDLPLAAAQQMAHGRTLYRDIWFDKPPLVAGADLLWGAGGGVPLRLAGALYVLLVSWLAFRFARDLWSEREGYWAASLIAFFLTFDIPSAVLPLASDLLQVAPHLAAVWMAWKRRPLACGLLLGIAFLVSPKAVFIGAACLLWYPAGILWMAAGFAAVTGATVAWQAAAGSLAAYWDEVWRWGRIYASATFVQDPIGNGLVRTADWAGFHAAALAAGLWFLARGRKPDERPTPLQWAGWFGLSLMGVAAGWRFFPRYYFQLLPFLVIAAARGFTLLGRRRIWVALLLLIPLVRFGPRYGLLAAGRTEWADTAMDRYSRSAAAVVNRLSHAGDTLFVWGYRPDLYVYTALPAANRFLDSQPLTGVPADRHLTESTPVETAGLRERRAELTRSKPTFVVDGLGLYNPQLAITQYPDLSEWLAQYREVGKVAGTVIYERALP